MTDVLLPFEALKAKGITVGKCQLWRLEKAGRFPKRVYPSAGRIAWLEREVDEYIAKRTASRTRNTNARAAA